MNEIKESEYLNAIMIVKKYTEQINQKTFKVLQKTASTMTIRELNTLEYCELNKNMSVRLCHILGYNFPNKKLCDITKREFLSIRHVGKKLWSELCEINGIED
jgi:hypothetical protein